MGNCKNWLQIKFLLKHYQQMVWIHKKIIIEDTLKQVML